MAIILTGSNGLFTRLGKIFGWTADNVALQGGPATARTLSTASWLTRIGVIETDYIASVSIIKLLQGDNGFGGAGVSLSQAVNTWNAQMASFQAPLVALAANTVILMADNDAGGLLQRTLPFALQYLINQMIANSTTVNSTTVSVGAQTSVGTPVGNPTVVVTALDGLGLTAQYSSGETLAFTCTQDSYTGGATVNQEQLSATGQAVVTPTSSFLWPGGSGKTRTLNAVDPTKYNQGAATNLLTNGDFATFTNTNYPDNFVYTVGVATTNFAKVTSPVYFGVNSLKIIGDSSTLAAANQSFNTATSTSPGAGGTPGKLSPQTLYCANLFYQLSGASPAAGVLALEVVDGGNTIIQNSQGVNQTVNIDLSTVADTDWHALSLVFSLPAAPPTQPVKLRFRLSTALTTATNVFIAGVSCTPMVPLYGGNAPSYAGGPSAAVFAGSTPLLKADGFTISYVPTWGVFQQYFQRFFLMSNLGLTLPNTSGGSPTVVDTLVS